ncbi:GIY-YIG nuclease family protein [Streptomyces scabiei]|uniref:GIY-YIG nuclease family protein n=1 Tax=Streptomyces scabiei TaxID=1930 RepID=UPI0029BAB07A|nr:GIY-YIG nuclease family protein [Streptomyces scabiei]MDX3298685.1 GIY-YIG nuclease family protein [Streptomyces scabiei]
MTTVPGPRPTAVYRLYDAAGQLLYVGSAFDPTRRLRQHAAQKSWWPEVDPTRTLIEWHGEEDAAKVEHTAARTERPAHGFPKRRIIVGYRSPRPRTPIPRLATHIPPGLPAAGELTCASPTRYLLRIGGRTATVTLTEPLEDGVPCKSAKILLGTLHRHGYRPPADPRDPGYPLYERIRLAAA